MISAIIEHSLTGFALTIAVIEFVPPISRLVGARGKKIVWGGLVISFLAAALNSIYFYISRGQWLMAGSSILFLAGLGLLLGGSSLNIRRGGLFVIFVAFAGLVYALFAGQA